MTNKRENKIYSCLLLDLCDLSVILWWVSLHLDLLTGI